MRWNDFMRLRQNARVAWKPTQERGRVIARDGREVWVMWASGRLDKLHVEEDCANLLDDNQDPRRAISVEEMVRRQSNANLREVDREDTPENLARIWREAREIREARDNPAKERYGSRAWRTEAPERVAQ